MNIIVCMKQVPASSNVEVDPINGTLKRGSADTKTNPYDLYSLEVALRLKERFGGKVTVLTMGPDSAKELILDAYSMGADEGIILSDRKFAGSDVLATSYTLSQGIKKIGEYDLIICGKQTTDGDTAQIGPAIAEHLSLPHTAWVSEIVEATETDISVRQNLGLVTQVSRMSYPCLITVDAGIMVPRLPSYRRMREVRDKEIKFLSFSDLLDQDLSRYGLIGSPTTVEKIFPPEGKGDSQTIEGDANEKASAIVSILQERKYVL